MNHLDYHGKGSFAAVDSCYFALSAMQNNSKSTLIGLMAVLYHWESFQETAAGI